MEALAGGGNAVLLAIIAVGLAGATIAGFLIARYRDERLFTHFMFGVTTTAAAGYLALLLAVSLTSSEKTLPQAEVRWFCGFYETRISHQPHLATASSTESSQLSPR